MLQIKGITPELYYGQDDKPGLVDLVTVRGTSAQNAAIQHAMEEVKGRGIPDWLSFNPGDLTGRIASLPTREQINLPVQEQLIVELYSK